MVQTIVATRTFYVTVDAFDANGDVQFSHQVNDLSFMQAADYAECGVNYFKFAMLDHSDWFSVQIEINSPGEVIEVIEIQRDR